MAPNKILINKWRTTMTSTSMNYDYKLVSEALTSSPVTASTSARYNEYITPFAKRVCKELRVRMIGRDPASYWIYRDDCPYVLGWVGFGDYRDAGDGTPMYVVQARTITNGKYAPYNSQFFMKMSTKFNVALRNAKKFIRMMSPQELAGTRMRDASNAVDNVVEVAMNEYNEIRAKVIDVSGMYSTTLHERASRSSDSSILLNELRHLMNSNHEFIDASFSNDLVTFFAKHDELNRLSTRIVPMWFVHVYDRMEQQVFDVVNIDEITRKHRATFAGIPVTIVADTGAEVTRYTPDTLPEEIMQKLSVLNILQANQYVDDVGFSAGDGMFYVLR